MCFSCWLLIDKLNFKVLHLLYWMLTLQSCGRILQQIPKLVWFLMWDQPGCFITSSWCQVSLSSVVPAKLLSDNMLLRGLYNSVTFPRLTPLLSFSNVTGKIKLQTVCFYSFTALLPAHRFTVGIWIHHDIYRETVFRQIQLIRLLINLCFIMLMDFPV